MNTATFFAESTPAQAASQQPVQAQSLRGCVEQDKKSATCMKWFSLK
jgi:hypothetical protein